MKARRTERGFAYIAAVVLLIVVAGLATAMVRLTATQQNTANDALLVARASQAARAGTEWMFYQLAYRMASACPAGAGSTQTLTDFRNDTGFLVTVKCSVVAYNEGQDPTTSAAVVKNIYRIESVACNGSGSACPDNGSVANAEYTERRRVASICIQADGNLCY